MKLRLGFVAALCVSAVLMNRAILGDGAVLSPEVRKTAIELREKAFAGTRAVEWVRGLTDEVGPRLAGSQGDVVSIAWAMAKLKELGFSNVRAEKVMVPAWQRGVETGEV